LSIKTQLSIQERLKDLRVEKGLTLEQLPQQTKIPASTLGSYESDDYKEIPHRNLIVLAKFYEVSADYLLGMTENRQLGNTALSDLHLSDVALTLLKGRYFETMFPVFFCVGHGKSPLSSQKSCGWLVVAFYDSKGRQHFLLSPLDCLTAKPGGAVNGGRSPFILTIDWLGWVCHSSDFLHTNSAWLFAILFSIPPRKNGS